MTRRVTIRQAREWQELYAQGWTLRWIAERSGRNHHIVMETLRDLGVEMRPAGPHPAWCDECCTYQYLNHRTGWCSSCTRKFRTGSGTIPA